MCGIAGVYVMESGARVDRAELEAMSRALAHRGPDGEGIRIEGPTGLVHRRLAILDLSDRAAEPMGNEDGTVWLTFNGEIYNHLDWVPELERRGHRFRSSCDAEVVIHLYEEYGPEMLSRLEGMFALALWDGPRRRLLLARDRLGIKPLYYAADESVFLFASELKALLAGGRVPARLNLAAVDRYFSFLTVTGEESIVQGVRRLPPGQALLVEAGRLRTIEYWSPDWARETGPLSLEEAADDLDRLGRAVVSTHLQADVPVGLFLSGGLDSSAIARWASIDPGRALHSFSIAMPGQPWNDESAEARATAEQCGFLHHEMTIDAAGLPDLLARMAWLADEPFAICSSVGVYTLAQAAREHVKVVLTGDGGDEILAGYIWRHAGNGNARDYLRRTLYLDPAWKRDLYRADGLQAIHSEAAGAAFEGHFNAHPEADVLWRKLYTDLRTTLVDEMLTKTDRMTMGFGLEARVPLLDRALVEWAMAVPSELKAWEGEGKRVLRRLAERYYGPRVSRRKKLGFNVPQSEWLRGPLRPLVEEMVADTATPMWDLLDRRAAVRLNEEHQGGQERGPHLFALLMFHLWGRAYPEVSLT